MVLAQLIYWWMNGGYLVALPAAVVGPALFFLFRYVDLETVARRMGLMAFGIVYCGILFTFLALLKRDFGEHGGDWVYVVLMTAWLGDTGAYFAGRLLGKRKLYPAISPGKTWAGAVGGLAGSFLGAIVANVWFFPELGWGHGAVITLIGGALGQSGDLVESMLKRAQHVKDSGTLLPGHGGMLDRVDAVLFIAPWVYLYAHLAWR
jgi:phosphatidate cytidylyltransferase